MFNLRLDRLASLYLCHPLARVMSGGSRARLPILMYHGIQGGTSARHPYYETNTSPKAFASQMKYLGENGYKTLDLDGAVRSLELGEALVKRVVITFDDGYHDFYQTAYPILCAYGFSATVFLVTGHTGEHRLRFNASECLTWSEVRELHGSGIRIGSHTVSHPELKRMSKPEIDDEISRSKQTIEDKIGHAVRSFSYPYAFPEADHVFVRFVQNTLVRHGYQNGVSTVIGRASGRSDRYFLPRLPINAWDDARLFQAKLEGGYDWLHTPQLLSKVVADFRQGQKRSLVAASGPGL